MRPDVTIMHVQRSDEDGNAHALGQPRHLRRGHPGGKDVLIIAEEIVPREVIVSDPNRVIGPSFKVRAVVHEPWGAYPSAVQGYYNRDHSSYHEYHERTRTVEDFHDWLHEWVLQVPNRAAYLKKIGDERILGLAVKEHRFAAPWITGINSCNIVTK